MKLGTRVFVQGLTKDGLADKEGVSSTIPNEDSNMATGLT